MNSSPLIDVQSISYTYPVQKTGFNQPRLVCVLHDLSFQVEQGEYLVVLGHNGSGKSTLARHCNALLIPHSGRVLVAGLDTRDQTKQRTIRPIELAVRLRALGLPLSPEALTEEAIAREIVRCQTQLSSLKTSITHINPVL